MKNSNFYTFAEIHPEIQKLNFIRNQLKNPLKPGNDIFLVLGLHSKSRCWDGCGCELVMISYGLSQTQQLPLFLPLDNRLTIDVL